MADASPEETYSRVSFATPRNFCTTFKSHAKEALFPDDPFQEFKGDKPIRKMAQYFIPIFDWLSKYNFTLLRYDVLAGITITSLAIPQGISYAKLGNVPPIIGLYSSFVPPLIYAIFGSSKHIAIGTVASATLLIASIIEQKVTYDQDPTLYVHLLFTATFITGVFQALLGVCRLGILVDFLSHSTIVGFITGTAIIISLQQIKGLLGMRSFTTKTDVVNVIIAIFKYRKEWRWEPAVLGVIFLVILFSARYVSKRNKKLFWVSAIAPMFTVVLGGLLAYFLKLDKKGIQVVGPLKKGINPISIHHLNFQAQYLSVTLKAGLVSGAIALAEGVAIGRSFAVMNNYQIDGNKEMIAFGLMNLFGSFTSCYLTTGPFSKSAVNVNAGARTLMSNIVMAICMALVLLFLAPFFSYTPLVALSAIIVTAMFGLIKYDEVYRLFKVDKFDFIICMACLLGVTFISMDWGLMLSVGFAVVRALLYVARPATCKLANLPDSFLYRDIEQYAGNDIPGMLVLQLGSPIYFANCSYIQDRIWRWIREENRISKSKNNVVEHVMLELSGVSAIDMSGIETLQELKKTLNKAGIKMSLVNPRIWVMEKMMLSGFVEKVGKETFYLSVDDAVEAYRFSMHQIPKATDALDNP